MTYEEWVTNIDSITWPLAWRRGQLWFYYLTETRSDIADRVLSKPGVDPFYLDENLPRFFSFIEDIWDLTDEDFTKNLEEFYAKQ